MHPTCSSPRWRAANCIASAPPRSTNTASTSRRTPHWRGASSRYSSTSRAVEDTVSILRGLKEKYEQHHGVRITDSALVAAATLSHRYISDRFLPDKAIDLVDEAAARLKMQVDSKPEELDNHRPRDRAAEDRAGGAEEGKRCGLQGAAEAAGKGAGRRWRSSRRSSPHAGSRRRTSCPTRRSSRPSSSRLRIELANAQRRGEYQRAGELGLWPHSRA